MGLQEQYSRNQENSTYIHINDDISVRPVDILIARGEKTQEEWKNKT
jgi:hypothetical protein